MFFLSLLIIDFIILYFIPTKIDPMDALYFVGLMLVIISNMIAIFLYYNRKVVYFIYFIYHFQIFINPYFKVIRKTETPLIYSFYYNFGTEQELIVGVTYLFFHDLILILFLLMLPKFKPFSLNYMRIIDLKNVELGLIILFGISIAATLFLISIGAWGVGKHSSLAIADTIREIARYNMLGYLIIGYYLKLGKATVKMILIYNIMIPIGFIFAMMTTSKAAIGDVGIVYLYNKMQYASKVNILVTIIVAGIAASILFPMMGELRKHPEDDFITNVTRYIENFGENKVETEGYDPENDAKLKRLNYLPTLGKAINHYPMFPDSFKYDYLGNFIGLIPRVIWKDKPSMGINQNIIGHDLEMLDPNDFITSIGITPLGEGYYEFGIFGIIFTPLFTALMMKIVQEKFDEKLLFGYVLHFHLFSPISRLDQYSVVIPANIKSFILALIVLLFFNNIFPDDKKTKAKNT